MVSLRELARIDAARAPPAWLKPLLSVVFFEPCPEHPEASRATRSGGCNRFCVDCIDRPLCHVCVAGEHADHTVIQVRRSSKHNAVKVRDVKAMLNLDEVQLYLINGEKVVFLNPRPQTGKGKAGKDRCESCARALLDKIYRFCSLGCKLDCMDLDFDIRFNVQTSDTESASSEDDEEDSSGGGDDDAAASSAAGPSKRVRVIAPRSAKGGDGAGTSTAAV